MLQCITDEGHLSFELLTQLQRLTAAVFVVVWVMIKYEMFRIGSAAFELAQVDSALNDSHMNYMCSPPSWLHL